MAIKLKAEKADVLVGEKYTIESTIENATDAKKLTYAVDKKEIATVDDKGVVTGVAKGTAVV
ncbi:MAG: Ig-like domain-containing protein, partial [Lachnospiraceae bacterium]|nr:Ig-like domain-containing protein [Lachnospiraceae bacterium]